MKRSFHLLGKLAYDLKQVILWSFFKCLDVPFLRFRTRAFKRHLRQAVKRP